MPYLSLNGPSGQELAVGLADRMTDGATRTASLAGTVAQLQQRERFAAGNLAEVRSKGVREQADRSRSSMLRGLKASSKAGASFDLEGFRGMAGFLGRRSPETLDTIMGPFMDLQFEDEATAFSSPEAVQMYETMAEAFLIEKAGAGQEDKEGMMRAIAPMLKDERAGISEDEVQALAVQAADPSILPGELEAGVLAMRERAATAIGLHEMRKTVIAETGRVWEAMPAGPPGSQMGPDGFPMDEAARGPGLASLFGAMETASTQNELLDARNKFLMKAYGFDGHVDEAEERGFRMGLEAARASNSAGRNVALEPQGSQAPPGSSVPRGTSGDGTADNAGPIAGSGPGPSAPLAPGPAGIAAGFEGRPTGAPAQDPAALGVSPRAQEIQRMAQEEGVDLSDPTARRQFVDRVQDVEDRRLRTEDLGRAIYDHSNLADTSAVALAETPGIRQVVGAGVDLVRWGKSMAKLAGELSREPLVESNSEDLLPTIGGNLLRLAGHDSVSRSSESASDHVRAALKRDADMQAMTGRGNVGQRTQSLSMLTQTPDGELAALLMLRPSDPDVNREVRRRASTGKFPANDLRRVTNAMSNEQGNDYIRRILGREGFLDGEDPPSP